MECGGKHGATPLWVRNRGRFLESSDAGWFILERSRLPASKAPSPPCFAGAVQNAVLDIKGFSACERVLSTANNLM